jgi:hypothetical protein
MPQCQYGCGLPAQHFREPTKKLPRGRWSCSPTHHGCPANKDRRAATCLDKYGATNLFSIIHSLPQYAETSQAMRTAASDRMTDTARGLGFSNPETLARANQAFRDQHGVENPMHLQSTVDKYISTNLDRYGVPCYVSLVTQYQRSKIADQWLDSLSVPEDQREQWIVLGERRIKVDAYDPDTNTVYEFHGDYWHGNPRKFAADVLNKQAHKTMGQLYEATVTREAMLREHGFNLIVMWEDEFRRG